ncbi:MAG: hypothetical protein ACREER_05945 [Alphaproteobacteria bacterium]
MPKADLGAYVATVETRVDSHYPDGGAPLAREALDRAVLAVGRLAWQQRSRLAELDLNPIVVTRESALVVDVVVVLR